MSTLLCLCGLPWFDCSLPNVYVCRSSNKMPAAVKAAVRGAAEAHGKMSEDEAKEFVEKMERDGKLIEECWS